MLPNSPTPPGLRHVHPPVHPLWGSADTDHWTVADTAREDHGAPARCPGRLGEVRAQRGGAPRAGKKRINGAWPGAIYGVREPFPQETALSWAEVHLAVREGIL